MQCINIGAYQVGEVFKILHAVVNNNLLDTNYMSYLT